MIGAVLRLCEDQSFLSGGWVPCKELLANARSVELANFAKWVTSLTMSSGLVDLDLVIAESTGVTLEAFGKRVTGVTKGQDLNGDQIDLAFGTLYQDVRSTQIVSSRRQRTRSFFVLLTPTCSQERLRRKEWPSPFCPGCTGHSGVCAHLWACGRCLKQGRIVMRV